MSTVSSLVPILTYLKNENGVSEIWEGSHERGIASRHVSALTMALADSIVHVYIACNSLPALDLLRRTIPAMISSGMRQPCATAALETGREA